MRILVAGNDPALGDVLQSGFGAENYAVDLALNGEAATSLALDGGYDAAILDLNLEEDASLNVLRDVRARRQQLPILILANATHLQGRVQALDLGADDLVLKPFAFAELSARIRALLRRHARAEETVLRVDDLELHRLQQTATRAGRKIDLTRKEFTLLEYLMRNAGKTVTRAEIRSNVWQLNFDTRTNIVDVYVSYLRNKVDAGPERRLIRTVRGAGYRLQPSN